MRWERIMPLGLICGFHPPAYVQGDRERGCGLPVSPLMDRTQQGGMTRSQVRNPSFHVVPAQLLVISVPLCAVLFQN